MTGPMPSAGRRFLSIAAALVERLATDEWPRIDAAATLMTEALATGHTIYAFGSGHSHMVAEELFHRAGGLVRVHPILFDGLMLHAGSALSTALERLSGVAQALLDEHPMGPGDVLIIASNSGGNPVTTELAVLAREAGVRTIGLTNLAHATSTQGRNAGGPRLHALVDVAIDNGGVVGDAAVTVDGVPTRVAATSTVTGVAIVEALVAEVVERLVARGVVPEVFTSSNLAVGDAANARFGRPEDHGAARQDGAA